MGLIPITGVPSNFRVPGQYAEVIFAQGPSTASTGPREVIIIAPKTATGTYVVNTVNSVTNENLAEVGGGSGSPLHRALRMVLRSNKQTKLWALPYDASSGGGSAAATSTVTYAGAPTKTGVTTVTIASEPCSVSFSTTDTPTTIAANLVLVVNSRTFLPVTATSALGVVTLTAKIAGASQGDGTVPVIRVRAEIDTGVTTTVASSGHLGSVVAGADGAVTELSNLTAALATIEARRFYYMGITMFSSTALTALRTHITNKSEPRPGLRSVGVAAFNGILATAQTTATGQNYERLQFVWQPQSEHDPAELMGNVIGIRQKRESTDSAFNLDGYSASDWLILPAFASSDWPDTDDQNDALNDGVTPIASNGSRSYLVMSVTTRSKNSTGAVDDFRASETHRVSVADDFTDTLLLRHQLNYQNKKLKKDELLPDGSINVNQRLGRDVVTPETYKPFVRGILSEFGDPSAPRLQDVVTSSTNMQVDVDPSNSGRLELGCDLHVIDLLHQLTARLAEVSTG